MEMEVEVEALALTIHVELRHQELRGMLMSLYSLKISG